MREEDGGRGKSRRRGSLTRVYATVVDKSRWQTRVTMLYVVRSGSWVRLVSFLVFVFFWGHLHKAIPTDTCL